MALNLMKILRREYRRGWYHYLAFNVPVQLNDFITANIITFVTATALYINTGFIYMDDYTMNWYRFGNFLLFNIIISLYGQSFCYLILSIFIDQNIEIIILLTMMFNVIFNIGNGFVVSNVILERYSMNSIVTMIIGTKYLADGY
ncbi:hypothetical protein BLA29_012070, partial [Euroglyphus maynei]